ncbi:ABC transporter substrate-binding protein [Streptomyces sp. NRRL S-87]|uniref:ABC transporter substrate-binding protein n=1 Tax=Streptomyces sp. NRRL S-87 TaxID=1463920 RepID=UPI001F2179EC|nr:extracellular solute-binding protein [Streptomyces sp. NRRL S-87]
MTTRLSRALAAAGTALCLTATLAGCGGLASDNDVTLKVVAADYGDGDANSSIGYWKDLAAAFTADHPGVKVEVSVYSWEEVDAKVAEMVKKGEAPDVAQIGAYADYAADGKLYTADELLSVATQADFLGPLADAGKVKRVQYGMPFVSSTRLLFYNKRLFKKAGIADEPRSWDDLEADARKLKGTAKTPFALPLGREEAQAETMQWLLAGGGGYTDSDEAYAIDSAENVKTFEWLREHLYEPGLTGPVEPWKLNRQDAFDAFARGEVGMLNGHPKLMKEATDKGVDFGMVPLPTADGRDKPAMGVADWVMAFKNGHRKETGQFLDFVYDAKNVTRFTNTYGLLPVTTSGYRAMSASTAPARAQLKTFLAALPNARLYPVGKKSWAGVSEDIKADIGKSLADPKGPVKTLEAIASAARQADQTR